MQAISGFPLFVLPFSLATSALLSAATIVLVLRNADRLGLVQEVTERSSHTKPTPAGGGIGIVAGTVLGTVLLAWQDFQILLALALALAIAIIGFIDDVHPLSVRLRLAIQCAAVGLFAIFGCWNFIVSAAGLWAIPALALLVFAGVWWINLFNFMDGIDGYAGSQAVFMLCAGALLATMQGGAPVGHPLIVTMLSAAAATAGFLIFNWPPARIFMGDTGSTFLGLVIFACGVSSITLNLLTLPQWLILGSIFLLDASVTIIRRFLAGERTVQSHKSHAYQRLARRWYSHQRVTASLIAIDCVLLLPLSAYAGTAFAIGCIIAILAGIVFCVVIWSFGGGTPD